MAQYSNLKAYIEEKIYENGTQAITGDILQDVLKVMTDDLGEFYQTGGVASPSTDPGTPDAKVIYLATEAGTYTNFGGITLAAGEVALLVFDTSWTKETLNVLSSANGGVKNENLADGAVTTPKIANGAVEEGKIADASVTSGKLGSGAVTTEKIADGAATTDKLADKAVATGKLGDKAVTSGKIADKAVGTGQIADEAITEGKIADDAVTSGKIAENAVTTAKIDNGAVTEAKIQNDAVKTAKIGSKAVTTAKIADKAVTSGQLGDKAVTSDKIADGAVGSDQLAEGAFSAQNLADGSVTTNKLADDAVTAEKIADGAVTADKFANGSVTTIKLGSGAVTTEKIGDGMVTRQKLADSSVGTSKIIDGAVTGAKLQEGVRAVINVNALNGESAAYGSAALARAAVPSALRILGLHVIYLLAGGWFEDEFIGSDVSGWGTASNWRAVGPVSVSQNTLMIGGESAKIHPDSFAPITGITTAGCTLRADGTIEADEFFASFSVVSFSISSDKEYILDFTNYQVSENYAEAAIYKNGNLVKVLILSDGTTTHFAFKLNTLGYDVDTLKISIDSHYESEVICLESRYFKKSEVNTDDIANDAITTSKIADNSVTDVKLSTDIRNRLNTQEVNASTSIKSIRGVGGALTYTVYAGKTIDVTTTVGQKIIITDSIYRNLGRIDVGGLNTFVLINNVLPYYSATLQVLAIVDADGFVLGIGKSSAQYNDRPTAINTASYSTAKYLYFTYNPSATPTAVALDKTGIGDACNLSVRNFQELGGGKENTFLGIEALILDDMSVGDLVTLNTINIYRATGCINVAGRKDTINISKTMTIEGNSYIQYVVADSDNRAIAIVKLNTSNVNVSVDVPLYRYPNAEWVYFTYGSGNSNIPTITSKGINYTEIPLDVYVAYANDTFGENSIGSTFVHTSSPYRSTFAVDVKGIKGDFFIKDALNGGQNIYAIVVDGNDRVLDIITYSQTSESNYTTEVYVNLSKYNDATKIYISGAPNTQYLRQPSGAVVTYSSIEKRVDVLKPEKATLLLHFDGIEGEHDYMTARKALVESYGLKGSFIISKSCFVDQDFTKAWLNNDLEEQFWQLIKDGWDVGLYPSTVSSAYDEDGWKTWMATAIGGLAQKGIFNITTWCAGNLEINADVVNACKANGLRILRGGNGSYAYTLKNTFMPQTLTESKCIVNKAYFVNYQSKLPAFKDWLDCVCASKTCASFFTHQVLDSTTDTNNITTSLFSDMLAYIKTKVDNGELDVLNFREWYAKVNPTDGHNFDYDRLLKMQLFNNQ